MKGTDYAKVVTHKKDFAWNESEQPNEEFCLPQGAESELPSTTLPPAEIPVVVYDFGVKYNILRCLRRHGFDIRVIPATTTAKEALSHKPACLFLSNGPGDPASMNYAVKNVKELVDYGLPTFGICLGHQILGQALGAKTFKLKFGHRGCNHPVKNINSGKVEITSQNHGFAVDLDSLPPNVEATHVNLNDNTSEGIRCTDLPAFSVQYHPESSPGPHDSRYLFQQFIELMKSKNT